MTLVLFALVLTAVLVIVALVIDFGFVRQTRQDSKATADAAVAAGLQSLAPDAVPKPWPAVCTALGYVKANEPDRAFVVSYMDGTGTPVSSPCSAAAAQSQVCVANSPSTWAWIQAVDGSHVVDIKSGYVTPDPNFPEDASTYAADNGAPSRGGCDQLAVIVSHRDEAYFGGIVGATQYDTAIRSVGRVQITTGNLGTPAFLILERTKCAALSQSVGSQEGGVIVDPAGNDPALIHSDSAGTDPGCGGNAEGNFTVYSGELGQGQNKRPGIVAKPTGGTPPKPGRISLYALQLGNTAHAYSTAAGISPTPVDGGVVSRQPIDDKYNPSSAPTITNLHAFAQPLATATTPPDSSYTELTCADTTGVFTPVLPATKLFVNCPGGYTAGDAQLVADTVVFNGPVTVPNHGSLFLPVAETVVVGGDSNGGLMVAGDGRFGINSTIFTTDDAAVGAACIAPDGQASRVAQLVVFGGGSSGNTEGAMNLGGRSALCKTAVYLAGPSAYPSYTAQTTTDGTYHPTCTSSKPCPKDTDNTAVNAHFIASGYVRWTAPNQVTTGQPDAGSQGLEDLALWTESAQKSEVKSGGILDVKGVFFLPNARMETRSPAQFNPRDAQFIARSLKLLQGTLRMQPTAANNVQVPILTGVFLVR